MSSIREYEDFNERSVLVDALSGRGVEVTEKDPGSVDFNLEKEVVMRGPFDVHIEERVEMLAKFRAYRKSIENLLKKIEDSNEEIKVLESEIKELQITLLNFEVLKVLENKNKGIKNNNEGCLNKDIIYKSELKRLKKLVASLKVYGL